MFRGLGRAREGGWHENDEVVAVSSSDPFDFSDFGAPRPQAPGPGGPPRQAPGRPPQAPQSGGGFATGFDPWAGAPPQGPGQHPGHAAPTGVAPVVGRDAFGNPVAPVGPTLQTAGPPLVWFAVAMGLAVVGLLCTIVGMLVDLVPVAPIAGWLLAGPIAIGALAVYSRVDTRRRSEAVYSAPTWAPTLYWAVLALCLIGIAVGAWQLALWAGRL